MIWQKSCFPLINSISLAFRLMIVSTFTDRISDQFTFCFEVYYPDTSMGSSRKCARQQGDITVVCKPVAFKFMCIMHVGPHMNSASRLT